MSVLKTLNILLDSQVTLAWMGTDSDHVLLQDVYRILIGSPFIVTPFREWEPGQQFPLGSRRGDFGGIVLRTGLTVVDDVWENFFDVRYKHINYFSKYHYMQATHLSKLLNFRMNITFTNSWGYPINDSNNYDGLVGLLQREEIDFSAAGIMYKTRRMDVMDYAGESACYDGEFLFLKPALSDVSNIYTLPFTRGVWIAYVLIMAVSTLAMYVTQRTENQIGNAINAEPLSVTDSVLTLIAVTCQEGSPRDPQQMSSRMIFIFVLMLSLFVTTSYSANIVSLLQTTSSAINTFNDLLNSPFILSMKDILFNIKYVNESTSSDIKDLFFKHLFTQPHHEAFTSSEVGVEKMRKGLYAFHGDAAAFKVISDTYEDYEKCRLKTVRMYTTVQIGFAVGKGSPLKERIKWGVRWLQESGMNDREHKFWHAPFPECQGNTEGFKSVGIQDFRPLLLVYAWGLTLSIGTLVLEILYAKLQCVKL